MSVRIGLGFDAHRFAANRTLRLGGVEIPHERGLAGHSDGDALLHALADALLGAIAAPDLGSLFPSTDETWRNRESSLFVERARDHVRASGFRIVQVDMVLIAEEPFLQSHVPAIRARVSELLEIPVSSVGLKAKTSDGMGFTGRREGLAAQVVALVEAG